MIIYVNGISIGDYGYGIVIGETLKEDYEYIDLIEKYEYLFSSITIESITTKKGTFRAIKTFFNGDEQQNINAKLTATVVALSIALHIKASTIMTDSDLILNFYSKKLSDKDYDMNKIRYIETCISLRKEFENRGGSLVKIEKKFNEANIE